MIDFLSASKDVLSDWLSVRPEVFFWWLLVEVIGLITFPVAFAFLGRLPDRGYSFAKALGLLLLGFFLFIGATVGVITNSRGGVLLILLLMALAAAVIVARRRDELAKFLAERWVYVLLVEALFAVAFITAAWLRSYVPDISGTEKPSEFAVLNGVLRSDQFPALDPWLTPFSLSYYYFGFIIVGGIIKLTAVAPEIGFNLGVALIGALTVVAAFGAVYNLVAAVASVRRALAFGLVGVLLVVILGNLEGVFEMLAAHGIGPSALYAWVGIEGLNLEDAGGTSEWYPDKFFFFWRSTRIPSLWDIREYPFFSLLLGDLHPHFMAMPFTLLSLGVIFNLLRTQAALNAGWARDNWAAFGLLVIVIGSLSFLNAWSYPPTLALLLLAVLARNYWQHQRRLRPALLDTAAFGGLVVAGSLLFYLPFYLTARGGLWGLAPVEVTRRPDFLPFYHMVTHPKHLFIAWGPFLWLTLGLAAATLSWAWLRRGADKLWLSLLPGLIPLGLWALTAVYDLGWPGFGDELEARFENLLTLALLIGLLAAVTLAFVRALARKEEGSESLLLALGAMGVGVLLIYGTELFFQIDHLNGSRENTVFKLGHHAWLIMGVGGAFALYYLTRRVQLPELHLEVPRLAWSSVALLLLAAGLVLPLASTFNRTNGFTGPQTLDGLAFLQRFNANEYEAVRWLRDNVTGAPVILEATDFPFTEGGRVSSRTGLPTVLEWPLHEKGYRGPGSDGLLQEREADVEIAFKSTSIGEAQRIFDKYEVRYVYVGQFEREKYGDAGVAKFAEFMVVAYQNPDVTIYRMPEAVGQVSTIGSAE